MLNRTLPLVAAKRLWRDFMGKSARLTEPTRLSVGEFNVLITPKKVKRFNLRFQVERKCFTASAPYGTPMQEIERLLQAYHSWMKKMHHKSQNQPTNLFRYQDSIEGKTVFLWGQSVSVRFFAARRGGSMSESPDILFGSQIEGFYSLETKLRALQYINYFQERMAVTPKKLTIRKMKTRWGTCNHRTGRITLNSNLSRLDPMYLRYVVVHELAHLKHPNHSREFWEYVGETEPNFKQIRSALKAIYL